MARIILVLVGVLAFGAALALAAISWSVSTGWIGAAGLVGWAVLARRRWSRLNATTGEEPGAPERVLWHRLTGTGILLGHLTIALLNPSVDLHVGSGNTLAIDSWTILIAMIVSAALFHGDARERDERHRSIAARGVRSGYTALIVLLLILLFYLGFAPPDFRQPLTHWLLANLLSGLIVTSLLVMQFVQLLAYAPDGRDELQE